MEIACMRRPVRAYVAIPRARGLDEVGDGGAVGQKHAPVATWQRERETVRGATEVVYGRGIIGSCYHRMRPFHLAPSRWAHHPGNPKPQPSSTTCHVASCRDE